MDHRFHLFVRRHRDAGYTVSVLTHPHLATFAEDVDEARADIARVAARLLERNDRGIADEVSHWVDMRLRRIDLQIRAVQHKRLLTVPMRFTVLTHSARPDEKASKNGARDVIVRIPRLGYVGELGDIADLEVFVEEVVRNELYMAPLARLLSMAYDGEESIETLTVNFKVRTERTMKSKASEPRKRPRAPSQLSEASRRLNDEAEHGTLDRAYQRDGWVSMLQAMLGGGRRASVVIVGPAGSGKTALVHELVHRFEEARAHDAVEIYTTSASRIVAGMRYLGEWQARVQRMIDALRTRKAVLHIESLAELLSTGGASSGLDIAGYLVPALETAEISVVVEATPEDFARAERSHPALVQALAPVHLAPLPTPSAILALRSVATRLGRAKKIRFTDDALLRAIDVTDRFGDGTALPGSAIQLLRDAAQEDVKPGRKAAAQGQRTVDAADITRAFTTRTGYPAEIVDPAIPLDPDAVMRRLQSRVVGQDAALTLLRDLVVTLKTSLGDPSRPLGSFLMLGPTGVGKTESALALAEYLFGDATRMTRIDMSEYAAPGSALRLVNDWGGRDGALARRVREQPFGIVLFDEVEKADASVHDLLLQILGEGRLTDATGRTVSFRNTIVMLTSNLGADNAGRSLGFGATAPRDAETHYVSAAAAFFRPELLNRFDHIVPYRPLARDTIEMIAKRALDRVLTREGLTRREVTVRYEPEVVARLADIGFDARYGARPLQRAVEHWVVAPLARVLASRPPGRNARVLELVVRGDAVAVAPTTRPEVDALDPGALAIEFRRVAEREPDDPVILDVLADEAHARRQAEWLAERYVRFAERHGGSAEVLRHESARGVSIAIRGRGARLLRHEAGVHEFTLEGLDVRVTVGLRGASVPDALRLYGALPVPSVYDGATDYEMVCAWDDALTGDRFDRMVLARAVER
jgi:ATP-dependent Clp protease ATP-binding subunit ClpC